MISAAIWDGKTQFCPTEGSKTTRITIIIGVGVLKSGARRIVRNEGPAGLLIGPEDGIESKNVCRRRRLVFPERFTAFRLGGSENFRGVRRQTGPAFITMMRCVNGLKPILNSPLLTSAEDPGGALKVM